MTTASDGVTTAAPAPAKAAGSGTPGAGAGRFGDLLAGLLLSGAMAAATWRLLTLPASYLVVAGILYVAMAAVVLLKLPPDHPGPGIGAANRVTLGRAALAVPIGALCIAPASLDTVGYWWVIVVSTVVMILDGVDGRIARRTGTETAFGARFDMELDAALILALSVLVYAGGRAGAWCLLIGLMRYLFVAAGPFVPALRAELPESLRRKVVCVVQGVVLLVALGPIIPAPMATAVVAGGLVSLVYSFAVDIRWALLNPTSPTGSS